MNEQSVAVQTDLDADVSVTGGFHQDYLNKIRSKIESHKVFPRASKLFKESGIVKVRFKILKNGEIQLVEVIESSQFKRLDDAAIKAVQEASPFEPLPSDFSAVSWSILVPMRFELH